MTLASPGVANIMSEQEPQTTSRDYYFDSYSHFGIHEEMLKDEVRTLAYKNAIQRNKHLFEGKVVLDVGCGTGILCMFAASAGAKLVIGVDMSGIIDKAKVIVKDNGFEGKIVLLKGKMEEVQLPVDHVDIIISEWMGYFLLYESMLDTVLYARDRYLVPGGLIFPDKASMMLVGIEDAEYKEQKISFWDDVYGFNMRAIKEVALREPLVDIVAGESVVTSPAVFKEIDINTVTKADLAFLSEFSMVAKRSDYVHALLGYFDITFSCCHKPVYFSTGPADRYTHWKQTVFYLPQDMMVNEGDVIKGRLSCVPNGNNPRDLDIAIEYVQQDPTETTVKASGKVEFLMC